MTCIGNNGTFGDRQFIKCDLANFSVVLVRSAFLIKTDRRKEELSNSGVMNLNIR